MRGKRDPGQESPDDPDVVVQEISAETRAKPTKPIYSEVARIDCEIADREQVAEFLEFVAGLLRDKQNGGGIVLVVQKRVPKFTVPSNLETKP